MDRYNNEKGIQAELALESQGAASTRNLSSEALDALKSLELNVITRQGGPAYSGH
jgi:hypothetical protein